MGEVAAKLKSRHFKFGSGGGGGKKAVQANIRRPLAKLGRTTSFNAGDEDTAATKAASEGYDPLNLLQSMTPAVAGTVMIQKTSMKVFSKWEENWAELRGSHVLLYGAERPEEDIWKRVDIINNVRGMFQVSGCDLSLSGNKTIKLVKDGEAVIIRFDKQPELAEWKKALSDTLTEKSARLSDFEVIAPIGKGAAGRVFLVRHKPTGRKMALKAVGKEESVFDSRSSYRHAIDERAVLGLTEGQPSFVQLRYAFQTQRNIYLVTDFCEGGDLFFYLASNQSGLDEDRACFILAEIILAMERLHELDVLYRDLKPENILLDAAGHIQIADFGLCKRLDAGIKLGRTSTICGTHSYVAPEMLGAKSYGASVDIFTIGIFLYHIMVGRPPFDASDMEDVKANVVRLDKIQYYDDFMSPEAIDFLKLLFSKDPEKRLGCGTEGVHALRSHAFFARIDWDELKKKTGQHEGGLFTGGYDIPPGMAEVLKKNEGAGDSNNEDPSGKPVAKSGEGGPWYKSTTPEDDHLLRNFDLVEWEGVRVDDKDDHDIYGDCRLWPLFKFHKRNLDENYIVGFNYTTKQ
jgi:serine/threonine protein kinase